METQGKVWKVSEVNKAVRDLVENTFLPFWVQGEVGTLNIHRSGHVYLTLKDAKSQLRAVFFGGAAKARQLQLQVGAKVEVYGNLTVYEVRGDYQFSIRSMRPLGIGDLQRKFDELKEKLKNEGLFDESRKKPVPVLPRNIGVISSPDGAAIRDFLQIINRRFPNINIKIYPAAVQGKGAEKQIAKGVEFFNTRCLVDVIVITRGGGSIEDLWAFNEEILARTIAVSEIPVISAVGHEIDFTICDFVADLRVPTPSAAAELVIGRQEEFVEKIDNLQQRLKNVLELTLERFKRRFENAAKSYVFHEPMHILRIKQQELDELIKTMEFTVTRKIELFRSKFEQIYGRLKAINPTLVLKRGYAIVTEKNSGKVVLKPEIKPGTAIRTYLSNGFFDSIVEKGQKNDGKFPILK